MRPLCKISGEFMAKGKSKAEKIIVAAVAVIVAAAVLVSGYLFWYKPKKTDKTVTGGGSGEKQSVDITPAEISYETAQFNGYKVPGAFEEILTQAEKDSAKACRKYGSALTVGDSDISEIEFGMVYFDMFIYAIDGEIGDPNGFTPEATAAPSAQEYGSTGYNWDTRLTGATADELQRRYLLFRDALENGFLPSDDLVTELADLKNSIISNAESKKITPDEELSGSYFEGATADLYIRNLIIRGYADEYEKAVKSAFDAKTEDSEVKAVYEKNPSAYNYVDVRIFTIFPDDDEGVKRAKKEVKDLESFYKFGADYFSAYMDDYESMQEEETRRHFITYGRLEQLFGESIAEWCFAPGRKEGDVEVIKGIIYNCLIFVEKPQYSPDSVNFYESLTFFNADMLPAQSEAEKKTAKEEVELHYNLLKKNNGSVETMKQIADNYNESVLSYETRGLREKVHASEMDYNTARWMFSPDRNKGDYEVLENSTGFGLYYYDGTNEGDTDAYAAIREDIADKAYESYYESLENFKDNQTVKNNTVIKKAAAKGEKACSAFAAKTAERQNGQ